MRMLGQETVRFIGASAASRQLQADISVAARADAKVLVTGETGVGKDVVARLLHEQSARRAAPLAVINCAGMPDTLLESELFGHVRGSFTGAIRDKVGLLEFGDGGTAFLDEAGEMSPRMQGLLLRFLETGEVQRVGCERGVRRVNVRIIAATNRDLAQQVAAGAFREDLYYRLNVIRIHVPPLRARPADVPALFAHFAELFGRQYGLAPRLLMPEAEQALTSCRWPGNVRELKNVVERLVVRAPGEPVYAADLPAECRSAADVLRCVSVSRHAGGDRDPLQRLIDRLLQDGDSFWDAVHAPFMDRDLSRDQLRRIVQAGLERTAGNYRMLVELFNMPASDYKRFLSFLRKHDCQVPFHAFRAVRPRTTLKTDQIGADFRNAANM
jgi:transcriptional regulator with GAF, ATPase, and Fis domain